MGEKLAVKFEKNITKKFWSRSLFIPWTNKSISWWSRAGGLQF
jgi:hypothetical protein